MTELSAQNQKQKLMSLKVASAEYGPSVREFREAVWRGDLHFIQFQPDGRIWLDRADVDKWILSNRRRHE